MVSLQSVLRGLKWNTGTSNGRHGTPYPENLISILLHADANMFPNIRLLIEVGCMFSVSSSEAERSFSVLKRIKTHLRNRMGEDCINVNESQRNRSK